MDTIFSVFGLPVTAYGLWMGLAMLMVWAGTSLYAVRKGMDKGLSLTLGLWLLPFTWFMARLIFVLANITYYTTTLSNLWLSLRFWDGGYAAVGAVMGVLLGTWLFARANRLPAGMLLDGASLSMLPALALLRMAEAGTDLGLGKAVGAAWMRQLPFFTVEDATGELVHAVFRYEAVAALMIFLVVIRWMAGQKKKHLHDGDLALVVLTLLGLSQTFFESLRDDGHMVVHFVRISQALSILAALWVLVVLRKKHPSHYPLRWGIYVLGVGSAVYQEFLIDSSEHPAVNYAFMLLALAAIGWAILSCIGCRADHASEHAGKG